METLLRLLIRDYGHDPEKVVELVRAMGAFGVEHLVPSLHDVDSYHRRMAAQLLALLNDRRAVEPLIAALEMRGLLTERFLLDINRRNEGYPSWQCGFIVSSSTTYLRRWMTQFAREMHSAAVASVQADIAFALGKLGDERGREPLTQLLGSADFTVLEAARQALIRLEMKHADNVHER